MQAGGNVVRLVGLYHLTRGAHTFFLRTKVGRDTRGGVHQGSLALATVLLGATYSPLLQPGRSSLLLRVLCMCLPGSCVVRMSSALVTTWST
jgi:hypothetical protein